MRKAAILPCLSSHNILFRDKRNLDDDGPFALYFAQNFDLDKKEHHKISNIPKFRREML